MSGQAIGKLNWKVISASEGYRSLKRAYVKDVQESHRCKARGGRSKSEFREAFKNAIGMAMKYSNRWGLSVERVLLHWEEVRAGQWWLAFYQEYWLSRNKPNQEGDL